MLSNDRNSSGAAMSTPTNEPVPSANTAQFQAFVDTPPEKAQTGLSSSTIVIACVVVVLLILAVIGIAVF
jgi:hypothetical protein